MLSWQDALSRGKQERCLERWSWRNDSLALGVLSKVGIVCLGVDPPILSDVLDAALEVPSITPQVKPGPCKTISY